MRKKVLIITSAYKRSVGESSYANDFIADYATRLKHNFDVIVLSPLDAGSRSCEEIDGVKIYRHRQMPLLNYGVAYGNGVVPNIKNNPFKALIVPFYLLYLALAIRRIVIKEKIDVIHAHWIVPAGLVAALMSWIMRRRFRLIITSHGTDLAIGRYTPLKQLIRHAIEQADAYTCVSENLKSIAHEIAPNCDVTVAPMGTDFETFNPDKRSVSLRNLSGASGPVLLFVGRLVEEKGIKLLVEAFVDVNRVAPNVSLWIVGSGHLEVELKQFCEMNDIMDRVRFFGYRNHLSLPELFASADLFVLPTEAEGMGLVCMEAMASGIPVMVTKLEVFKEFVKEGDTGYFIGHRDVATISKALEDSFKEWKTWSEMGQRARNSVISRYGWNYVIDIYSRLIDDRPLSEAEE